MEIFIKSLQTQIIYEILLNPLKQPSPGSGMGVPLKNKINRKSNYFHFRECYKTNHLHASFSFMFNLKTAAGTNKQNNNKKMQILSNSKQNIHIS